MTRTRTTKSGEFLAYHKRESGCPEAHKRGPWFFQPSENYSSGEVFSEGFPTLASALEVAEEWESGEALTQTEEPTEVIA